MRQFTKLSSKVMHLPHENVDTDQIIPARYLKVTDKTGLAEGLFAGWRWHPDGSPQHDFPFNFSHHRSTQILLTGDNFGCGSSREHAPWALLEWGIRAVISTSFADIFRNNSLKNGLLPIQLEPESYQALVRMVDEDPKGEVTIDLYAQTINPIIHWQLMFR